MTELKPKDGRKSFYGKALVKWDLDGHTLYSYGTPIIHLQLKTGKIIRYWDGYSVTTMRHINSFMDEYFTYRLRPGVIVGGKAWWDRVPLNKAIFPDEV